MIVDSKSAEPGLATLLHVRVVHLDALDNRLPHCEFCERNVFHGRGHFIRSKHCATCFC